MLRLVLSNKFKKDLKRSKKRGKDLNKLYSIITKIQNQTLLDPSYKDHPLTGNYEGFRELHVEPDWLLIYAIKDDILVLSLTRTGSHSEGYRTKRVGFIGDGASKLLAPSLF